MYRCLSVSAAAIAVAVSVGACSMPMSELLRDINPGNGNPPTLPAGVAACLPTTTTQAKLTAQTVRGRSNAFSAENALNMTKVNQRLQKLPGLLHPELRNEPVVQELLRAAGMTIHQIHQNNKALADRLDALHPQRRQVVSAALSKFDASSDADNAMLNSRPRDLNHTDFVSFVTALRHSLLELSVPSDTSAEAQHFATAFVYYFKQFINGKYYTRFGKSLAGPGTVISFNGGTAVVSVSNTGGSLTVTDEEIDGTVQVFLEFMMDYAFQTPVWYSVDTTAKTTYYYPGKLSGTSVPTVVLASQNAYMPITQDTLVANSMDCGIDPLKAEAIQYIATMAGNSASQLSGVVGGSFGGINLGVGVLGKISIGDNKTIHNIVNTAMNTVLTRVGEEAAWRTLYWIGYPSTSSNPNTPQWQQDLVTLIQQYLAAQLGASGT